MKRSTIVASCLIAGAGCGGSASEGAETVTRANDRPDVARVEIGERNIQAFTGGHCVTDTEGPGSRCVDSSTLFPLVATRRYAVIAGTRLRIRLRAVAERVVAHLGVERRLGRVDLDSAPLAVRRANRTGRDWSVTLPRRVPGRRPVLVFRVSFVRFQGDHVPFGVRLR